MGGMVKMGFPAIAAVFLAMAGGAASASTVVLDSTIQCSAGNAQNGISPSDVTGNLGGSSDCWGTLSGNDPGPNNSFTIGTMTYDYLAKYDIGDNGGPDTVDDPSNIGLSLNGTSGSSGTWSIASALGSDFLIVLKASNNPGFAAWLFEGNDALSTSGSWNVAWEANGSSCALSGKCADLSHLAIYAKPSISTIPVPAGLPLLLSVFGIGGLLRLRKRK